MGSGISESLTLFFLSAMPVGTVKNKYGTVLSFCLFWVLFDLFFLFCYSALSFPSYEESQTKGNVQDIHSGVLYYHFYSSSINTACESSPGCHVYHSCCFLCEMCTEAGKRVEHCCSNT